MIIVVVVVVLIMIIYDEILKSVKYNYLLLHLSLLSLCVSYWPWSGQMEWRFAFDACFGVDGLRLWIKSVPSKMGKKLRQAGPTLPACILKE